MDSNITEENRSEAGLAQLGQLPETGALLKEPPKERPPQKRPTRLQRYGRVGQWFQMLCFMNIPVLGFLYMLILAIRRSTPSYKRSFAVAYLLYRLLVVGLTATVLYVLYQVGLSFVDEILKYAKI